jgi:phosphoribosylformimino-5-aminoimidazole carboxamide ribotide isomerase
MLIIPAIDLRAGKCVRLVKGRLDRETVYSDDPAAMARLWERLGATRLHVVDLDGAFSGRPKNLDTITEIVGAVSIPIQVGGGIRDLETAQVLFDIGVERVILGTVAIQHPDLAAQACTLFGDRIIIGIDARNGKVAIEGWGVTAEKDATELAEEMLRAGAQRVIFTDIRRDGTLEGPNLEAIEDLARKTRMKVIASGGVSVPDDLRALKKLEHLGVEGVIIGKSLYAGTVKLEEALKIARGEAEVV